MIAPEASVFLPRPAAFRCGARDSGQARGAGPPGQAAGFDLTRGMRGRNATMDCSPSIPVD